MRGRSFRFFKRPALWVTVAATVGAGCALGLVGPSTASAHGVPGNAAAGRPPVVLIVFDAFPTVSLLDARGRIDRVHYPRFAKLAGDSTWFPYATTSVDETGRAFREIFTGRTSWRFAKPTYAANPKNLCTLLRRRAYRVEDGEEATSFCPGVEPKTTDQILALMDMDRPRRFLDWAGRFKASSRPTFYVKHVLLPHVPRVFLPSGHTYGVGQSENGMPAAAWTHTPWLIQQNYQRHLLQLEYTDQLLGQVLDRLEETGLYDRSLVVVTADHGESFGLPGEGRDIRLPGHAVDIALKPLFVKLPGQRRGKVVRRHVRNIDITPTIARVTGLRPRWRVQGRSLIGPPARRIPGPSAIFGKGGERVPLGSLATLRRRMAQSLKRKLGIFGKAGAFGIGPHRELHGTPGRGLAGAAAERPARPDRLSRPVPRRTAELAVPTREGDRPIGRPRQRRPAGSRDRGQRNHRGDRPGLQERGLLHVHLLGLRSRTVAPRRCEHGAGLRHRGRPDRARPSPARRNVSRR